MRTNITIKAARYIFMTLALSATMTINAQGLIAEYFTNDDNVLLASVGTEVVENEPIYIEAWMNDINWSELTAPEIEETIAIEDWMLENDLSLEEEALITEDWMTAPFEVELSTEDDLTLEDWMLNTKAW